MKFKLIEPQTKYYVKQRKLEATKISNHLKTTKLDLGSVWIQLKTEN